MNLPKYNSNDELPLTMNAKDIAGYLGISLTSAYYVLNSKNFPVLRIGKRMLVTRDNFLKWLNNNNEVNFKLKTEITRVPSANALMESGKGAIPMAVMTVAVRSSVPYTERLEKKWLKNSTPFLTVSRTAPMLLHRNYC